MKPLYFLLLLLLPVSTYAQSDNDIIHITDSLYNKGIDTNVDYQDIYDSVEYAMAARWAKEDIAITGFRWPCRSAARTEILTPTYRYLLEHKYRIDPYCISSGCIDQHYFVAYDSVINDAIAAKMGKEFFRKSATEAAVMDKNGAGLIMPYLHDSTHAMTKMLQQLTFMDTVTLGKYDYRPEFLVISFKNGKIATAYTANYVFSIQPNLAYMSLCQEITRIVSSYKWTGPLFNRLPAEKNIVLNLKTRELFFEY